MPRFAFKAKDASGREVIGHRDAASAGALAAELSASGSIPLTISEDDGFEAVAADTRFQLFEPKVSIDEVILFSHQMYSLSKAGISVVRAVRGLAESQQNPKFKEVLIDTSANLEAGADFATSLRRYPRVFLNCMRVSFMSVKTPVAWIRRSNR